MEKIITYRIGDAYRFPRNNLLRGEETFPDYQVRLLDKNRVEWVGEVHEVVKSKEPNYVMHIITLNHYVITHLPRLVKRPWHKKVK